MLFLSIYQDRLLRQTWITNLTRAHYSFCLVTVIIFKLAYELYPIIFKHIKTLRALISVALWRFE
jgi:hypothetical protein